MSDSGTDTFVGVVIVAVLVVAVVSAAKDTPVPVSSSTTLAPTPTPTASRSATVRTTAGTNIPGGALTSCRGTVIANDSAPSGRGSLDLTVTYSAAHGGRNCAIAANLGLGAGRLTIQLRFDGYSGRRWPSFAQHRGPVDATRSGAVYLDRTDHRCVRADARFTPADGGRAVVVSSGPIGCR
jgi:hypothetical protein